MILKFLLLIMSYVPGLSGGNSIEWLPQPWAVKFGQPFWPLKISVTLMVKFMKFNTWFSPSFKVFNLSSTSTYMNAVKFQFIVIEQ